MIAGRDAADFAIIERLAPGDVVVTQDTGLAAMVLGRGAAAISPRGRIFQLATIDAELEFRHAEQKHRRAGGARAGRRSSTDEDREHFVEVLERLLDGGRGPASRLRPRRRTRKIRPAADAPRGCPGAS